MTDYDYSENTYLIGALRTKAHGALLSKDWAKAYELSAEIRAAAEKLEAFCLNQVNRSKEKQC